MEILLGSLILSSNLSINKNLLLIILLIIETLMSIVTFIFYKIDKKKSQNGTWRTKEKTLLLLPWLMGGIGGLLGIYILRHKTNHWYFPLNNFIALVVQFSVFISIYILWPFK